MDENIEEQINIEKEIFKIKIQELNINGEGLSFVDNKKICVKNVLPNEIVEVEKIYSKKDFIQAKLLNILNGSLKRKNPICKYFSVCGGCDFQMVDSDEALKIKQQIVKKYFSELYSGKININYSPKTLGYRNKVVFAVENCNIGLLEEKSNKIVKVSTCLVAKNEINDIYKILKIFVEKYNKDGNIKYIVIRSVNHKSIITFVCKKLFLNNLDNLKNILLLNFGEEYEKKIGVYLNLKSSKKEILGEVYKHILGLEFLCDSFDNVNFELHPHSFFQINDEIRNKLYSKVLDYVNGEVVVEGYSGIGILSAVMSKKAKKVFSVELNKQATKDAENLKKLNKIKNIINLNGNCQDILPKLIRENKNAFFVIDPPRSGCDVNTLQALIDSGIKKILYISCNPYTLRQNLVFIKEYFEIKSMDIFDMFPNTSQMEILAYLERK